MEKKEKNEINDTNSIFTYQHTQLLYLLYEGYKSKALSSEEKSKIKELMLIDHPAVYAALKKYQSDGNVNFFWKNLKDLVYDSKYELASQIQDEDSLQTVAQLSSPGDSALIRQKKTKGTTKKEKQIKSEESNKESDSLNSLNVSTSVSVTSNNLNGDRNPRSSIWVKLCQQGCSPQVVIKKRYEDSFSD
jgi:hypothetical protein